MQHTARQIHRHIQGAKRLMLIPHQNPDGDALGSVAAFMQWLRTIDKAHTSFCATPITPRLKFLPHLDYITIDPAIWQDETIDTIIVFDSGDLRYAGVADYIAKLKHHPTIINIDHHITNERFGLYNMVMPGASSTTEVLYRFFSANDIEIDEHIATCLLTGLMTDTDNFTNGATSHIALAIAGELLTRGGDIHLIRNLVFRDKSIPTLQLWGAVLSRLEKNTELDIVYTYLTQADLKRFGVGEVEAEGIANFMNNLADGRAGLILKELPNGQFKGSFRTTRDDTDVAAFAKKLGGGGHKKAAGFTVDGPIAAATTTIFSTIKALEAT